MCCSNVLDDVKCLLASKWYLCATDVNCKQRSTVWAQGIYINLTFIYSQIVSGENVFFKNYLNFILWLWVKTQTTISYLLFFFSFDNIFVFIYFVFSFKYIFFFFYQGRERNIWGFIYTEWRITLHMSCTYVPLYTYSDK